MKKIYFLLPAARYCTTLYGQEGRVWATYYGGTASDFGGLFAGTYTATDANGNVYLAGTTQSTSGISYLGYQNSFGGGSGDGFLVKFDASGNRLWATYYGNNGDDRVRGLCLDNAGNVYLSGFTTSISGIASGGGFQNSYGGGTGDAFLVKFDANGNRIWSTYYGGTNDESGYGVTTDAAGNVYLTGESVSTNGISYLGFQNMNGGSYDAFLVKFDANGNRIWATYYGGTGAEFAFDAVTDAGGNVYLVGETSSATAIASGGFQNTYGGAYDGFLVKFNASGARQWATYYGGSPSDCISGVCIDNAGRIYCSGQTGSTSG